MSRKRNASHNRLALWIAIAAAIVNDTTNAFHLSMVASRAPFGPVKASSISKSPSSLRVPSSAPITGGVTSGLISQLAVVALKLRLKDQKHVSCDVNANTSNLLLRGQVGPVTVKGRGWQSRLGLTCRAIEATVDNCNLDLSRVLSSRKLVLTTPANGNAMIALNAVDFGNFITHPLMRPPGVQGVSAKEPLKFMRDGAKVDAADGSVSFFGTYLDSRWEFTLRRGTTGKNAQVAVKLDEVISDRDLDMDEISRRLADVTSSFFNEMVFELDGTFLSFRDMMITGKGKDPSVMLALSIMVKKFPSAGLEF